MPVTPTVNEHFSKMYKIYAKIAIKCAKIPHYCPKIIIYLDLGKYRAYLIYFIC